MPPVVIDLRSAEDRRDVVHRAVQALAEGGVVAFPTETVYGLAASALDEDAVGRLLAAKDRTAAKPLTLAIKSADEARDYAPDMCPLAQRLARRCWPGPVTLVVDDSHPESLVRQLPPKVQQAVSPAAGDRPARARPSGDPRRAADVGRAADADQRQPRRACPRPSPPSEVVDTFGDEIDLVVDDGPCRFGQPSSVVRVVKTAGTRCCGRAWCPNAPCSGSPA